MESVLATSDADVLLYVDDDDSESAALRPASRVFVTRGPRIGRGAAINHLAANSTHPFLLLVCDDVVFTRTRWDQELSTAIRNFPNTIGLAHLGEERNEPWVSWPCISRRWFDAVGWFNYPKCTSYCQDTILQALGEALGRITRIQPPALKHNYLAHPNFEERLTKDTTEFLWFFATEFGNTLAKLKAEA